MSRRIPVKLPRRRGRREEEEFTTNHTNNTNFLFAMYDFPLFIGFVRVVREVGG
jgi:hypothetical protein